MSWSFFLHLRSHACAAALLFLAPIALGAQAAPGLRPYGEVIVAGAVSDPGLWTTHRVGDAVYFELPASVLDTDLLLSFKVAASPVGEQRLVRWERQGGRVVLRAPHLRRYSDPSGALRPEERRPGPAPVVETFPVAAEGKGGAVVVDVTRLFTGAVAGWTPAAGVDPSRTVVEETRAFPENVIVTVSRTVGNGSEAKAERARWNFVRLPAQPMMPRLYDRRMGVFFTGFHEGVWDHSPAEHVLAHRWRLEKKDPSKAVSEPVEPIVYYIDPKTPPKWRPWIRKAVEAWQPALEAAGFRNAIVAREAPDDPEWSIDDVRHSVLHWASAGEEYPEFSRPIYDPRTGEYLQFGIGGASDESIDLTSLWYFAQAGGVDPRARRFPLPDSIRGAMLQFVMMHEVGHTLGIRDGHFGKFAYTVDQVRSPEWIAKMGHAPSIINYTRMNYVAQPGDGIGADDLIQKIGPADHYTIRWLYAPIPGARTAEEERPTLDRWAEVQDTVPMYRYTWWNPHGPDGTIENVYTTDPVAAAGLGHRNIRRIMGFLSEVTLHEDGRKASFRELYDNVLGQWVKQSWHVVSMVGGFTQYTRAGYEARPEWTPLPAAEQRRAMAFLDTAVFRPPLFLLDTVVSRRIEPFGEVQRIVGVQSKLLEQLFEYDRLHRLAEAEQKLARSGAAARSTYTLTEMLGDLRRSLWKELERPGFTVDAFRQGLQQAHVTLLVERVSPTPPLEKTLYEYTYGDPPKMLPHLGAYERSLVRVEVQRLRSEIERAMPRAGDAVTRAHLRQLLDQLGPPWELELTAQRTLSR